MIPDFANGSPLWEAVFALAIFLVVMVAAWVANRALSVVARRVASKTRTQLDDLILKELRGLLTLFFFVMGVFLAASNVSFLDDVKKYIKPAWTAAALALAFLTVQRIVNVTLRWYEGVVFSSRGERTELLALVRRFLNIALLLVGALLVLDNLGIQISPLLAGLGIGGLAVALALQPTLSNLFAGTYLVSGNVLKAGDFLEMEGGVRGYVVEVGWRSTRLRTPFNNLVIIPNSRLADSILTNYSGPSMDMGLMVEGGVSYSSNLARVREVALEVASEVIKRMPEAVEGSKPWFGYGQFGESNVDFWLWVQGKDRIGTFAIKTELMISLHERFAKEGIEINYPVRKLIITPPDGTGGPMLPV